VKEGDILFTQTVNFYIVIRNQNEYITRMYQSKTSGKQPSDYLLLKKECVLQRNIRLILGRRLLTCPKHQVFKLIFSEEELW